MFPAQLMPRAVELVQGPGRVSPLFILSCLCRGPCRGARSLSLSGFTCPFCVQPTWSESWLCHGVLVAMGTGMLHNSTAGFRVGRWCCRTLHETFQTSDWASLGQLVPSAPHPTSQNWVPVTSFICTPQPPLPTTPQYGNLPLPSLLASNSSREPPPLSGVANPLSSRNPPIPGPQPLMRSSGITCCFSSHAGQVAALSAGPGRG